MIITTRGRPTRVSLKLCKEALRFFCDYLLTYKTFAHIEVELNFSRDGLDATDFAATSWEDRNDRARLFTIEVDPDLSIRTMLLTLAHEAVHVKQYATGELKDYVRVAHRANWKGDLYETSNDDDYWDWPWEIEAHGREKGLYLKFVKYMKDE